MSDKPESLADTQTHHGHGFDASAGRLEVRCPSCHTPLEVAVDTQLTDLTCSSCGSQFSLVDQSQATRMAPPLLTMGRFDLIERLGVGGFGTVWKARDKELDRTVAVKVPRQGGMTPEETEKFFREARAAAQLHHPNIVSVHEVGRDGDTVFIVSDFVRGVTLGDWLTGQKLTSREATELCAKMADALDHAHQRGVIHRDLKPANIMIDGAGEPHIMDFGLARREIGEVTVTVEGHILGTPAYMSPEQAQGEAHKADRRSDVYSLGVILFQLLTGELPFRGNARMLVHQVINDPAPSPRKLNSNIAKDLETITLRCLEKEPIRRYQTAHHLADELNRFLAGKPIEARPVGAVVHAWRWCRRNSLAATLILTIIFSLVAGVVTSSYFAVSASREAMSTLNALKQTDLERKRLERVNAFFMDEVFGLADPNSFDRAGISLVDALDFAAAKIDDSFADDPDLRVAMQDRLGEIYRTIDEPHKAIDQFEKAVAVWQTLAGPLDSRTLKSRSNLGFTLYNSGRFNEAREMLQSTLADQTKVLGAGHRDWVQTAIHLGLVLMEMRDENDIKQAESTYQSALATLGQRDPDTLHAQSALAWTLRWRGRGAEALELAKKSTSGLREVTAEDNIQTMYAIYNLAVCLRDMGQVDEAVAELERLLVMRQKVLGPAHVETLYTAWRLAEYLHFAGRSAEARAIIDEVYSDIEVIRSTNNWRRGGPLLRIAQTASDMGANEQASDFYEVIYQIYTQGTDKLDRYTSPAYLNDFASTLATSPNESLRNGQWAVEIATKACELKSYQDASFVDTLAAAYAEIGDFESAVKWSEKSLELLGENGDALLREKFTAALANYKAKQPLRQGD